MRYLFSIVMCGYILGATPSCLSYLSELGITEDDVKEFVKLLKSGKLDSFKEASKIGSLGNLTALLERLEKGDPTDKEDIKKKIDEEIKRLSGISSVVKKESEELQKVSETYAHNRRMVYAEQSAPVWGLKLQMSEVGFRADMVSKKAGTTKAKTAIEWIYSKKEEVQEKDHTNVISMEEMKNRVNEFLPKAELILEEGKKIPKPEKSEGEETIITVTDADGNPVKEPVEALEDSIKELKEMLTDPTKAEALYKKNQEKTKKLLEKKQKEMGTSGLKKKG